MSKEPISAVIYTKDNPNRVVNLVKHLDGYVEEIVVIDSSSPENYARLKNQIGDVAKLYNFPPLGYADPFHKLGASLVNNNWILHLDDDEIPSPNLLNFLKNEFKPDDEISAFLLPRLEDKRNFIGYQPRLYNRKKMIFTGIVHWVVIPINDIKPLDKDKLLFHHEQFSFKKWKIYALLDSYAIGYKILWIMKNKIWHPVGNKRPNLAKIFSKLAGMQFLIGKKIGWFLAVTEYLIACAAYALKNGKIKFRILKLKYFFLIFTNILKDFNRKIVVWENLFKAGSLNDYLGLNRLEDFEKLRNKDKKGLDLLISLIEEKAEVLENENK